MKICPACNESFPDGSNFCPFDGYTLEASGAFLAEEDPYVGVTLDRRYLIQKRIGQGGMGVVYAAKHVVIEKQVAIKILRNEFSSDPGQVERFIREARAASRIGHPNIIDITDFGALSSGEIFLVMEYLDGHTLAYEIKSLGLLPIQRVLNFALQTCHALNAAHCKGIVHRDLKPENIFIVRPSLGSDSAPELIQGAPIDQIKLLDFGIAKITWEPDQGRQRITRLGSIFGTPYYMSPEQAEGKDTDARTDIYALGCILYEMLSGVVPFNANTFKEVLDKHCHESPRTLGELNSEGDYPDWMERIVKTALCKTPDGRYQSMEEMAQALAPYQIRSRATAPRKTTDAADSPSTKMDTTLRYRVPMNRKAAWLSLISVGVIIMVFLSGMFFYRTNSSTHLPFVPRLDASQLKTGQEDAGLSRVVKLVPDAQLDLPQDSFLSKENSRKGRRSKQLRATRFGRPEDLKDPFRMGQHEKIVPSKDAGGMSE